jgi:hypothetical protein
LTANITSGLRGSRWSSLTPVYSPRQDPLPGGPGVAGPVQATIAAARPQRPLGGDVDHVRVARVDNDHADVLGVLQPQVFPGGAAVEAPVNAVAVAHVAAADVLAGADPNGVAVVWVDGDGADRVRTLTVEDRRPGRPAVFGLPDTAAAHRHVPDAAIDRIDRDVGDPAGHQRRSDLAPFEPGEGRFVESGPDVLFVRGEGGQGNRPSKANRQQRRQ